MRDERAEALRVDVIVSVIDPKSSALRSAGKDRGGERMRSREWGVSAPQQDKGSGQTHQVRSCHDRSWDRPRPRHSPNSPRCPSLHNQQSESDVMKRMTERITSESGQWGGVPRSSVLASREVRRTATSCESFLVSVVICSGSIFARLSTTLLARCTHAQHAHAEHRTGAPARHRQRDVRASP